MCSTDTQIIYYNKAQFAEIGIEGDWQPTTWAEVLDVAQKLKEANSDNEDYIPLWFWASSTYPEETSMRTFQLFLAGTADDSNEWPNQLYSFDEGKWVCDTAAWTEALNFVNDICNTYAVGPTPAQAADSSAGTLATSDWLKDGTTGMQIDGSWKLANYKESGQYPWPEVMDEIGMATLPTSNGQGKGEVTVSGGWTWAVPAMANNSEGGIEFLKYLCSYDGIMARCLYNGETSPRLDVAESEEYQNQSPSAIPYSTSQLGYSCFRPAVDGYSSITTSFTAAVEDVAIGNSTPEEAVENLKNEMIRQFGEDMVIVK